MQRVICCLNSQSEGCNPFVLAMGYITRTANLLRYLLEYRLFSLTLLHKVRSKYNEGIRHILLIDT